ncbi:MAG: DUF819 family protein [Bacteroidales bacterium]|nr:DUF819 family protein [Bacteroidales bacterium]MBN2817371.1 DUF819 family protein [Bacteroidales bacterium]
MIVLLVFIYVFTPFLIIFLTEKYSFFNKVGAIIIAYIFGLILGHIGILPHPSEALYHLMESKEIVNNQVISDKIVQGELVASDLSAFRIFNLQDLFTNITIPLSLPLLLFSLQIKLWIRMSVTTLISMLLAILGVVVFIVIGYYVWGDDLHDANKIAGMMVGLYTGGTPNLAALKQSLNVDVETYLMTHTYDTAVGVLYLFFLITFGKDILRKFLRPYPKLEVEVIEDAKAFSENAYDGIFSKKTMSGLLVALSITILIVGVSAGLGMLVDKKSFMLTVILSITTLSILASFISSINKIEKTFELGMYFIIVFSVVVASMADISKLIHITPALFIYITVVYFGALFLHGILSKIFKVDADTLMVTSTALLCSPPFVPLVAGALKNKEVIVSGLTVGIMGYAIGNYLGILLAGLL